MKVWLTNTCLLVAQAKAFVVEDQAADALQKQAAHQIDRVLELLRPVLDGDLADIYLLDSRALVLAGSAVPDIGIAKRIQARKRRHGGQHMCEVSDLLATS